MEQMYDELEKERASRQPIATRNGGRVGLIRGARATPLIPAGAGRAFS
jgi:hypothetical protein